MKRLRRSDPFDDIYDQMQSMFNQFQSLGKDFVGGVPVDIREEDGTYVLTADLPGVEKEDISLKADENSIEISAESSQEIKEENEKYLRRERSAKRFRRRVTWPSKVDPDTISAKYEDGVLTIEAEKSGESGTDIEIE